MCTCDVVCPLNHTSARKERALGILETILLHYYYYNILELRIKDIRLIGVAAIIIIAYTRQDDSQRVPVRDYLYYCGGRSTQLHDARTTFVYKRKRTRHDNDDLYYTHTLYYLGIRRIIGILLILSCKTN